MLDVKTPIINIDSPQITVSPVINLKAEDLVRNEQGHIVLPVINVALTIYKYQLTLQTCAPIEL